VHTERWKRIAIATLAAVFVVLGTAGSCESGYGGGSQNEQDTGGY
jgi:hypothetical protein